MCLCIFYTSPNDLLLDEPYNFLNLEGDTPCLQFIPTVAREVFDVTGAGDTVAAALALALAAGATLCDAAMLANHAAGLVVGKIGTATTSASELLAACP